jgi:hypothetical protein
MSKEQMCQAREYIGSSLAGMLMSPVQRSGIQLPRARCIRSPQKSDDLAREAVSCNAGLGRTAAVARGLLASFDHCREREPAEPRGMRLPHEACAARLNQPSDEACGYHTRHVPHD